MGEKTQKVKLKRQGSWRFEKANKEETSYKIYA